jgi:micrococcal nuclease
MKSPANLSKLLKTNNLPVILGLLALLLLLVVVDNLGPVPINGPFDTDTQDKKDTPEDVKSAEEGDPVRQPANVARIVDGDTIVVTIGEEDLRVRLIGIDSPETVHPSRPVQCYGEEAKEKLTELIDEKTIWLEKDVSETDRFGRLLRYVYVGDIFVNEYMVREGYAFAVTFPPDIRYRDLFAEAQAEAEENKRGLWSPDTCDGDVIR